jgi:uncharacterized protein YerC
MTRSDESRATAARLYAEGLTRDQVGKRLGVAGTTVSRWLGDSVRKRGTRPRADVTNEQVWHLRFGEEKLTFEAIHLRTGLSKTAVRKRIARLSREAYEASP